MFTKLHPRPIPFGTRVSCGVIAALAGMLVCAPSHAGDGNWHLGAGVEQGTPGGWIRVRENAITGTRLGIHDDLHVQHMQTLRLRAWKALSARSELHLGFATSRLSGHAGITAPVDFNGTTVAPGRLDTITHFRDFLAFDAAYWRRLFDFGRGGQLWGSIGAQYQMLNFRLDGTIASNSVGHELKEDFYVQELPIPTLGLHLRYPLAPTWRLRADVSAGRLPWVNSLRTEGGEVRLAQTDVDASVGIDHALSRRWNLDFYVFHRSLVQSERSHEDGNYIRLHSNGVGLRVDYAF